MNGGNAEVGGCCFPRKKLVKGGKKEEETHEACEILTRMAFAWFSCPSIHYFRSNPKHGSEGFHGRGTVEAPLKMVLLTD